MKSIIKITDLAVGQIWGDYFRNKELWHLMRLNSLKEGVVHTDHFICQFTVISTYSQGNRGEHKEKYKEYPIGITLPRGSDCDFNTEINPMVKFFDYSCSHCQLIGVSRPGICWSCELLT